MKKYRIVLKKSPETEEIGVKYSTFIPDRDDEITHKGEAFRVRRRRFCFCSPDEEVTLFVANVAEEKAQAQALRERHLEKFKESTPVMSETIIKESVGVAIVDADIHKIEQTVTESSTQEPVKKKRTKNKE